MMMSGRMALSVIAVSTSVSPFFTEDEATAMFMTSAPRRLPAISNEDCVRVEGSKKRLICVRPRRVVFFFSTCRLTSTASLARSSNASMSNGDSPSIPRRCRCGKWGRAISPLPYGLAAKKQGGPAGLRLPTVNHDGI